MCIWVSESGTVDHPTLLVKCISVKAYESGQEATVILPWALLIQLIYKELMALKMMCSGPKTHMCRDSQPAIRILWGKHSEERSTATPDRGINKDFLLTFTARVKHVKLIQALQEAILCQQYLCLQQKPNYQKPSRRWTQCKGSKWADSLRSHLIGAKLLMLGGGRCVDSCRTYIYSMNNLCMHVTELAVIHLKIYLLCSGLYVSEMRALHIYKWVHANTHTY